MSDESKIIAQTESVLNQFAAHIGKPHYYDFASHPMTPAQLHMLKAIRNNPNSNVTELADIIGCTKGRITALSTKLIDMSLVVKTRKVGNDKDTVLKLTQIGKHVNECHDAFDKEIMARVTAFLRALAPNEKKAVHEYLKLVESALNH